MARSYKKTPITSMASGSEQKKFRTQENKACRRRVRVCLQNIPIEGNVRSPRYDFPHPKEYGNEWASPRDGKSYFGDLKYKKCNDLCNTMANLTGRRDHYWCTIDFKKLMRK